MEILLVEDVAGVGDIGEIITVRPGFARNYLIPRGVAVEARAGNSRSLQHKMNQVLAKKRRLKDEAEKKASDWRQIVVPMNLRVGSGGKVFGSINSKDISEALKEQSIDVDRRRILLGEPLRKLGRFPVSVKLHAEVTSQFTVEVTASAATEEEEKKAAEEARNQIEIASIKKQKKEAEAAETEAEDTETGVTEEAL
jgi:large subunit ribosomal protein L9